MERRRRRADGARRRVLDGEPVAPDLDELRAGSEVAWSAAVRQLGGPLRSFLSLLGTRDPDETLANVFLDLARSVDRIEGDWLSFRDFAFAVARRRAIDDFRYVARRPSHPVDPVVLRDTPSATDVEQAALDSASWDRVVELLAVLTPTQREIITLRFVIGLTIREVATITASTETGVKANQRRALAALRRHLGPGQASPLRLGHVMGAP